MVQGGRVPEFQITPDPARLPVAGVTVADILDAVRRTNLIDSPGLIESDHHLVLALVSGQVHTAEEIGNIVVKTLRRSSDSHYRCRNCRIFGRADVRNRDRKRKAGGAA